MHRLVRIVFESLVLVCLTSTSSCSSDDDDNGTGGRGGSAGSGTGGSTPGGTGGVAGGTGGSTTGGSAGMSGSGGNAGSGATAGGGAGGMPSGPQCPMPGEDSPSGKLAQCLGTCPNGECDTHPSPFYPDCSVPYPVCVDDSFDFCVGGEGTSYCLGLGEGTFGSILWVITCGADGPAMEECPLGCGIMTDGAACL